MEGIRKRLPNRLNIKNIANMFLASRDEQREQPHPSPTRRALTYLSDVISRAAASTPMGTGRTVGSETADKDETMGREATIDKETSDERRNTNNKQVPQDKEEEETEDEIKKEGNELPTTRTVNGIKYFTVKAERIPPRLPRRPPRRPYKAMKKRSSLPFHPTVRRHSGEFMGPFTALQEGYPGPLKHVDHPSRYEKPGPGEPSYYGPGGPIMQQFLALNQSSTRKPSSSYRPSQSPPIVQRRINPRPASMGNRVPYSNVRRINGVLSNRDSFNIPEMCPPKRPLSSPYRTANGSCPFEEFERLKVLASRDIQSRMVPRFKRGLAGEPISEKAKNLQKFFAAERKRWEKEDAHIIEKKRKNPGKTYQELFPMKKPRVDVSSFGFFLNADLTPRKFGNAKEAEKSVKGKENMQVQKVTPQKVGTQVEMTEIEKSSTDKDDMAIRKEVNGTSTPAVGQQINQPRSRVHGPFEFTPGHVPRYIGVGTRRRSHQASEQERGEVVHGVDGMVGNCQGTATVTAGSSTRKNKTEEANASGAGPSTVGNAGTVPINNPSNGAVCTGATTRGVSAAPASGHITGMSSPVEVVSCGVSKGSQLSGHGTGAGIEQDRLHFVGERIIPITGNPSPVMSRGVSMVGQLAGHASGAGIERDRRRVAGERRIGLPMEEARRADMNRGALLQVRSHARMPETQNRMVHDEHRTEDKKIEGGGETRTVARSVRPVVSNLGGDNLMQTGNGAGIRGQAMSIGRRTEEKEDGYDIGRPEASNGWISGMNGMTNGRPGGTDGGEVGGIRPTSRGKHIQETGRETAQNTYSSHGSSTPLEGARHSPAAAGGVSILSQPVSNNGGNLDNSGDLPNMNVNVVNSNGANSNGVDVNVPNCLGQNVDDGKSTHPNKSEGTISSSGTVRPLLSSKGKQKNQEVEKIEPQEPTSIKEDGKEKGNIDDDNGPKLSTQLQPSTNLFTTTFATYPSTFSSSFSAKQEQEDKQEIHGIAEQPGGVALSGVLSVRDGQSCVTVKKNMMEERYTGVRARVNLEFANDGKSAAAASDGGNGGSECGGKGAAVLGGDVDGNVAKFAFGGASDVNKEGKEFGGTKEVKIFCERKFGTEASRAAETSERIIGSKAGTSTFNFGGLKQRQEEKTSVESKPSGKTEIKTDEVKQREQGTLDGGNNLTVPAFPFGEVTEATGDPLADRKISAGNKGPSSMNKFVFGANSNNDVNNGDKDGSDGLPVTTRTVDGAGKSNSSTVASMALPVTTRTVDGAGKSNRSTVASVATKVGDEFKFGSQVGNASDQTSNMDQPVTNSTGFSFSAGTGTAKVSVFGGGQSGVGTMSGEHGKNDQSLEKKESVTTSTGFLFGAVPGTTPVFDQSKADTLFDGVPKPDQVQERNDSARNCTGFKFHTGTAAAVSTGFGQSDGAGVMFGGLPSQNQAQVKDSSTTTGTGFVFGAAPGATNATNAPGFAIGTASGAASATTSTGFAFGARAGEAVSTGFAFGNGGLTQTGTGFGSGAVSGGNAGADVGTGGDEKGTGSLFQSFGGGFGNNGNAFNAGTKSSTPDGGSAFGMNSGLAFGDGNATAKSTFGGGGNNAFAFNTGGAGTGGTSDGGGAFSVGTAVAPTRRKVRVRRMLNR